MLSDLLHQPVS